MQRSPFFLRLKAEVRLLLGRLSSMIRPSVMGGLVVSVFLAYLAPLSVAAQPYTVEEAELNGGGGTATANGIQITSSVGGPSPPGIVENQRYVLYSGLPSPFAGIKAILVVHEPSEEEEPAEAGTDLTITAEIITNEAALEEATLYYRTGEQMDPTAVSMTEEETGYRATIPGSALGETGIAYYFVASDAEENTVRAPQSGVYSVPISLDEPGVEKSSGLSGGTSKSAYRLLSMPIHVDDSRPEAVLGDDIPPLSSASAYDPSRVRFFEPVDTLVSEFPRTSDFELGKAFWLITREEVETIDSGPGTVPALDEPIEIELMQGWNFIGTPFTASVPISKVYTEEQNSVVLRRYDSTGYNTPDNPVQAMEPFEGYALYADEATTLTVEPPGGDNGATTRSKARTPSFPWRLRVRASSRKGQDADNVAAVHPDAQNGFDSMDWAEPPALFQDLALTFEGRPDASTGPGLSVDVRPEPARGTAWPLSLKANSSGPVQLAVEGVDRVPDRFEVWLLDTATKSTWNLRSTPHARLHLLSDEAHRSLEVIVGTEQYVNTTLENHEALPQEYTFDQPYPNPSTGPVAFRFSLPAEEEEVSMAIYNVLGQKVAQLRDGTPMEPGYHTLTWDGRLSSGMYFVRLEAGSFRKTQKMVRIR